MNVTDAVTESILAYWFGPDLDDRDHVKASYRRWFSVDRRIDEDIAVRYRLHVEAAATGDYDALRRRPRGALALTILLDQFPRNIFRGTPRAFAYDGPALEGCRDGLARGHDRDLHVIERGFFYLPLEHAENLDAQRESVRRYRDLADTAPVEHGEFAQKFLAFAEDHCAIIERFGRFPHRNAVLGRTSTPAEADYLETSRQRFGQG